MVLVEWLEIQVMAIHHAHGLRQNTFGKHGTPRLSEDEERNDQEDDDEQDDEKPNVTALVTRSRGIGEILRHRALGLEVRDALLELGELLRLDVCPLTAAFDDMLELLGRKRDRRMVALGDAVGDGCDEGLEDGRVFGGVADNRDLDPIRIADLVDDDGRGERAGCPSVIEQPCLKTLSGRNPIASLPRLSKMRGTSLPLLVT